VLENKVAHIPSIYAVFGLSNKLDMKLPHISFTYGLPSSHLISTGSFVPTLGTTCSYLVLRTISLMFGGRGEDASLLRSGVIAIAAPEAQDEH
jgi:hypothetical protein